MDAQTTETNLRQIAVKGGGNIGVDFDKVPDDILLLAQIEGMKVLLAKGTSGKATIGLKGDAKATKCAEIAQQNLADIYNGTYKKSQSGGKSKESGAVMTEARRLAKAAVKQALKDAGYKVSSVAASEITSEANHLIATDPEYIATAKRNIEAAATPKAKLNVTERFKLSDADKSRAPKKGERPAQLSAKQAGLVNKREKAPVVVAKTPTSPAHKH